MRAICPHYSILFNASACQKIQNRTGSNLLIASFVIKTSIGHFAFPIHHNRRTEHFPITVYDDLIHCVFWFFIKQHIFDAITIFKHREFKLTKRIERWDYKQPFSISTSFAKKPFSSAFFTMTVRVSPNSPSTASLTDL